MSRRTSANQAAARQEALAHEIVGVEYKIAIRVFVVTHRHISNTNLGRKWVNLV